MERQIPKNLANVFNARRLLLIIVFAASVFFSILFLNYFQEIGPSEHAIPGSDYLSVYKPLADRILADRVIPLVDDRGGITSPGQPIWLALVFITATMLKVDSFFMIIVFNVLVAALSAVFLFLIAEHIWNPRIALLAAFLWMTYPIWLWFTKNPHTEVPFIVLFYAAIYFFLLAIKIRRLPYMFFAGVLLGIAALIRPIALFLPVVCLIVIIIGLRGYIWNRRIILAGVLLTGYFLMIFPWIGYVFVQTGRVVPLADGTGQSIQQGLIFAAREGKMQVPVPDEVRALMEDIKRRDLSTKGDIIRFSLTELSQRPVPFLELLSLKAARVWYATAQGWYEGKILLLQLLYLVPAALGIFYAFRMHRDKLPLVIFLLAVVGFFWFMAFSALSILRYMVPAMGFVMIFSALGVEFLFLFIWKKYSKERN